MNERRPAYHFFRSSIGVSTWSLQGIVIGPDLIRSAWCVRVRGFATAMPILRTLDKSRSRAAWKGGRETADAPRRRGGSIRRDASPLPSSDALFCFFRFWLPSWASAETIDGTTMLESYTIRTRGLGTRRTAYVIYARKRSTGVAWSFIREKNLKIFIAQCDANAKIRLTIPVIQEVNKLEMRVDIRIFGACLGVILFWLYIIDIGIRKYIHFDLFDII